MVSIEKILNTPVIIAINIGVILAAELTGRLFLDTGLIHIIALLFVVLGVSRVFVHYDAFDRYLVPFTFAVITAMIAFSFSHIVEYFSFKPGSSFYSDILYVDVTNIYISAMLLVSLGVQYFLAKKDRTWWTFIGIFVAFLASVTVTAIGFLKNIAISIEPNEASVYLYGIIVVGVTLLGITRMLKLRVAVSIMKNFAVYIAVAFVLIASSAFHYLFYDLLKVMGLPGIQIIYFSHFLFYAALSFIYLAFPHLATLGGLYPSQKNPNVR